MPYGILADMVVVVHLGFILFVLFGGLLALRWRQAPWVHIPAALWGALIEFAGWICPLTPLENHLRMAGGASAYAGGFVAHYIVPLIYPPGLTHAVQVVLGLAVLALNVAVYGLVWRRRGARS